mgnify:CR=1 FL=1
MLSSLFSTKRMSILAGVFITVFLFVAFAAVFSLFITFVDIDKKYIPFISSMCLSLAAFLSSYITAKKHGEKGFLIGGAIGLISFAAVTIISFIVSRGGFSLNTLFHFVLCLLAALIGGILGVGTGSKKII